MRSKKETKTKTKTKIINSICLRIYIQRC